MRTSSAGWTIRTSALALSGMKTVSRPRSGRRRGDLGHLRPRPDAPVAEPSLEPVEDPVRPRRLRRRRAGAFRRRSGSRNAPGGPPASGPRLSRSAPRRAPDGAGVRGDRSFGWPPRRRARTSGPAAGGWRRRGASSPSPAPPPGNEGDRRISTSVSSSISTSRDRADPPMSRPTGSDESAEKESDAPRLSSSSAISSLLRRCRPFLQLPGRHRSDQPASGRGEQRPGVERAGERHGRVEVVFQDEQARPVGKGPLADRLGERQPDPRRGRGGRQDPTPFIRPRLPAAGSPSSPSVRGRKSPTVNASSCR